MKEILLTSSVLILALLLLRLLSPGCTLTNCAKLTRIGSPLEAVISFP